jgi:hypothetical protein
MHDMMKRLEVQVLRRAGVTQEKVAELAGISVRAERTIEAVKKYIEEQEGDAQEGCPLLNPTEFQTSPSPSTHGRSALAARVAPACMCM